MTLMQLTLIAMLCVIALQWVIIVALLGIPCRHHTPVRMVALPTAKVARQRKRELRASLLNRRGDWNRPQ